MAFTPYKQWALQDTDAYIVLNSATLTVGDVATFAATAASGGFVAGATSTTTLILGVVVGFVGSDGTPQFTNSFAATATNQTVAKVRARVLPAALQRRFVADTSATIGTTSGSGDPGFFNLSSQSALTESGYVPVTTYSSQSATFPHFFSVGSSYASSNNNGLGFSGVNASQVVGYFNPARVS